MATDNNAINEWMELVKTVFWALILATVIRTVAWEPFNIPSGSMKPGLQVGDYLFVSKYAYGYSKYSAPFGLLSFMEGRLWGNEPKRGDVIVFKFPVDNQTDYIKRVIGLPGDTIQMRAGQLYLNGNLVARKFVGRHDMVSENDNRTVVVNEYLQTLPDTQTTFHIYEEGDNAWLDNTKEFTVPEGHYFMMGDNRDNSSDSRASVGFVPYENLIGRAEVLFFSTNGSAQLWEFWKWPWTVRYDRLFQDIQ